MGERLPRVDFRSRSDTRYRCLRLRDGLTTDDGCGVTSADGRGGGGGSSGGGDGTRASAGGSRGGSGGGGGHRTSSSTSSSDSTQSSDVSRTTSDSTTLAILVVERSQPFTGSTLAATTYERRLYDRWSQHTTSGNFTDRITRLVISAYQQHSRSYGDGNISVTTRHERTRNHTTSH